MIIYSPVIIRRLSSVLVIVAIDMTLQAVNGRLEEKRLSLESLALEDGQHDIY